MALPFKAVAFDMDSTFLRDDKTYDVASFNQLLDQWLPQGVHFIVASGNQLECLLKYFPQRRDDLTFISENGAHIVERDQELSVQTLAPDVVKDLIPFMLNEMHLTPSLSGYRHGYLSANESPARLKRLKFYFPNHRLLDDYRQLPADRFYQISFVVEEDKLSDQLKQLRDRFGSRLKITPSGNGSVDLTIPGVDKAQGLRKVLDRWQMTPRDLIAFGDGGNDATMLKMAGISWAMKNAGDEIKQIAGQVTIDDNNHDGVIHVLQSYL